MSNVNLNPDNRIAKKFVDYSDINLLNLISPCLVVCHDAGSANLIAGWLQEWLKNSNFKYHEWRIVVEGPAKSIFNKDTFHSAIFYEDISLAIKGTQTLISGTSWESNLENNVRFIASNKKIYSIAVLDHWVNYRMRFERKNIVTVPDAIWVSDFFAFDLAKPYFPTISIFILKNLYLENLIKKISPLDQAKNQVLYLLEPLLNKWGRSLPGEIQALEFFVQNFHLLHLNKETVIYLRLHPSEDKNKYDSWLLNKRHLNIKLDHTSSLSDLISSSRWVVGAETFAMVVALSSGRATYSSLPPWAHRCSLPHKEIIHLKDMLLPHQQV